MSKRVPNSSSKHEQSSELTNDFFFKSQKVYGYYGTQVLKKAVNIIYL